MDLAEAYVGPMIDAIYRRLIDRDFALEDPELVMVLTAMINILGHDNRGDRATEVLLMAAYGERGVLDRPNMRVMRWRNGALSGSDVVNEPGLGSSRTYQPGEMPMPSKPKPGLTRMHREMNSEATSSGGRRHNEGVVRWNNILRNLANRNAGRMILMDIEHELRAMDQARLTTDGIHFDSIEGQAWLNRVFQERLDELEAELFDTGVLKEEGTVSDAVITTFVPPSLETRLGTVPAVTNYRQQSSSEPGRRTDVQDRLGEAPMRRTIHPRRRIGPVNPIEETAGTSRSDTRSETTNTIREERRPSRGSLMWSRPIPSPWHIYKDELMN